MANRNTKQSLERFKYEVADELGVPLSDGYNGNLTAKQNGSVGGYMVKKMIEARCSKLQKIYYTKDKTGSSIMRSLFL